MKLVTVQVLRAFRLRILFITEDSRFTIYSYSSLGLRMQMNASGALFCAGNEPEALVHACLQPESYSVVEKIDVWRYNMSITVNCMKQEEIIMLSQREVIRPSADLRNHYNEISRQCREDHETVIITVNGRGDTVSMGYEEYQRMKTRIELLEILAEADEDVKYGRVAPAKDTFDDLRSFLKEEQICDTK